MSRAVHAPVQANAESAFLDDELEHCRLGSIHPRISCLLPLIDERPCVHPVTPVPLGPRSFGVDEKEVVAF
ncbi:MAG: hypothetical protein IPK15_24960 [Verrucomicrobia bacterium]|nr:hypothetical protein [Verrucomicrobiota bacterium]